MIQNTRRAIAWLATVILAGTLAACGSGTATGSCSVLDPSRNPSLPGCPGASTPTGTVAIAPLTLNIVDAAGATITAISPQRPGVVKVLVKDGSGLPLASVGVTLSSSDKTVAFNPGSGTALTDTSGVAQVGFAAGTQAGGFTLTAQAVKGSASASGTAGYSVSFPTLTLSPVTIAPSALAAGGTASLKVTVLDGSSPFAPVQSVTFTSPCATAGKAAISSPVNTVAGVATTSYMDKGCGTKDTITASTTLGGVVSTINADLTVLGAVAGQISFVSALPQNIAMKGTGGPGRQESSVVTFKVMDRNGNPVAGTALDFALFGVTTSAGTGGITITPFSAISGADGLASTTIASGIVNTPIRITAAVRGSMPLLTTLSDQLVISTGIPDQNSFSLSTAIYNVEAANYDGCNSSVGSRVRVSLADHFNNPVPDGTSVSFTVEGGTIGASCRTGYLDTQLANGSVMNQDPLGSGKGLHGECSVSFCGSNPRVADGRVTILAYALGEESYQENSALQDSINRYDLGELFEDLCEPYRNDAAISDLMANTTLRDSKLSGCPIPAPAEPYIDTNGNGRFDAKGDGLYNGVLDVDPATGQTRANNRLSTVHVRRSLVQVMSSSNAAITPLRAGKSIALEHCVDGTPFTNTPVSFPLAIRDTNRTVFPSNTAAALGLEMDLPGNILPAGTTIDFSTSNGKLLTGTSYIVPNTNESNASVWTYGLSLQSDAVQSNTAQLVCGNPSRNGVLTVRVRTPMGVVTETTFSVTD